MSTFPLVVNKTMKYGDWLWDREQEAADNRAIAEYDRREAIEKAVTFFELLEQMAAEFTNVQREVFMLALARDNKQDRDLIIALLAQTKEEIVKRRLAEETVKPRFAETSCSQCGKDLGPSDHGVSHCKHHR